MRPDWAIFERPWRVILCKGRLNIWQLFWILFHFHFWSKNLLWLHFGAIWSEEIAPLLITKSGHTVPYPPSKTRVAAMVENTLLQPMHCKRRNSAFTHLPCSCYSFSAFFCSCLCCNVVSFYNTFILFAALDYTGIGKPKTKLADLKKDKPERKKA